MGLTFEQAKLLDKTNAAWGRYYRSKRRFESGKTSIEMVIKYHGAWLRLQKKADAI